MKKYYIIFKNKLNDKVYLCANSMQVYYRNADNFALKLTENEAIEKIKNLKELGFKQNFKLELI